MTDDERYRVLQTAAREFILCHGAYADLYVLCSRLLAGISQRHSSSVDLEMLVKFQEMLDRAWNVRRDIEDPVSREVLHAWIIDSFLDDYDKDYCRRHLHGSDRLPAITSASA